MFVTLQLSLDLAGLLTRLPDDIDGDDYISRPLPANAPADLWSVKFLCEDYGGNFFLPWYKLRKPSKAYYASHIVLPNFVVCDISKAENHVLVYDERGQMKDAEALTSLRMYFHLNDMNSDKQNQRKRPEFLFQVMDNCVGQNKSHVVFMFYALLSVTLFKRGVAILYLLGGHSHLCNDRVTGQAKRTLQGKNLFLPEDIVHSINQSKGIQCELLSYTDNNRPMWTGFSGLLRKHLKDLPHKNAPGGYTKYHFFEFDNGILSVRDRVGSEVIYTHDYFAGCDDRATVVNSILLELFGPNITFDNATVGDIKLPRAPNKDLTDEKVASIATLMNLIPTAAKDYYPKITKQAEAIIKKNEDAKTLISTKSTSSKSVRKRPIIPTPGALHGRLQATLSLTSNSSSNKELFGALPANLGSLKVPAMRNFLMIGAVGKTKADITVSRSYESQESVANLESNSQNIEHGK